MFYLINSTVRQPSAFYRMLTKLLFLPKAYLNCLAALLFFFSRAFVACCVIYKTPALQRKKTPNKTKKLVNLKNSCCCRNWLQRASGSGKNPNKFTFFLEHNSNVVFHKFNGFTNQGLLQVTTAGCSMLFTGRCTVSGRCKEQVLPIGMGVQEEPDLSKC